MIDNNLSANEKYHRAKQWEIALFSLNNSASNLYLFAFGFLTYYSTGIAGLTTFMVGNLLGAVRLFDGLIDPTIGIIMDKVDTKYGRFRPIMALANIALILSYLILFNTHRFKGVAMIAVYVFALFFHKIGYSFQQTVTKAAQPALTNDPSQRPMFSVYDTIFSSIGVFALGQAFVSNILAPRHGNEFNLPFYRELIMGICIVSAILTILAMIGISRKDNKEYFGLGEEGTETKTVNDYLNIVKGNKPLVTLALCGGLMKFMAQLIADQAFLVILFGIILGNYAISGKMALYQIIPNLIIVSIFTRLATKRDLKTSYTTSVLLLVVSILLMSFVLLTSNDTTQIFVNGGFYTILFTIGYIGMKMFASYPTSIVLTMAADITDYETARSGRFASGLIGTIFSLTDSIASSLVPIIIGLVVAGVGFADAYPEATEQLTPALFKGGMILLVAIPIVVLLLTLFLIRKYPLDRKTMEGVQATIAAKKVAKTKT